MPRFQVIDTFAAPDPQVLVLAGCVVEGEVQPGMRVNVPCGEFMTLRAPILEVETTTRSGHKEVRLHVEAWLGQSLREDGVEIRGQSIEITPTTIKPKGSLNLYDPYEAHALAQQEFKCSQCGSLLEPPCGPDGPAGPDLEPLAQNAKRLGWSVPAVTPDGILDLVTCYCPPCAKKIGLKSGENSTL